MTRVIFKSRGIANRIDRKMEILRELRFGRDFGEKCRRRQRARRFVAVNRREQTKAYGIAAVWPVKNKARQRILFALNLERPKRFRLHAWQSAQRIKKGGQ